MIDIHNHILFDIDDGAESLEDSIQMCRDAFDNGITQIVLTPHFIDYKYVDAFIADRDSRIVELNNALIEENIPVKLYSGAELFLNDEVFMADNLDELTLGNSKYMLCEFPLGPFDVTRVTDWIDELIDRGYVPVVAHPERYFEFHRNHYIIDELIDRDVVFQVNIDSLIGNNGEAPQMMAIDMIERHIAMIIGTDAHHPIYRHNRIKEKFEDLSEEITEEMLEECMLINPRKILDNKDI